MLWMLSNFERLAQEKIAFENLQRDASWLKGVSWGFHNSLLKIEADIEAHGKLFPVKLIYPDIFPASPPTVFPREKEGRWSSHQYGPGGELCLEWGPDNWLPEVTGAQMLESAYDLLKTENLPRTEEDEQTTRVPSRHALSQGQEMRRNFLRFIINEHLQKYCELLAPDSYGKIAVSELSFSSKSCTSFVTEIKPEVGESWKNDAIPELLKKYAFNNNGIYAKINLDRSKIKGVKNWEQFYELLKKEKITLKYLTEAQKSDKKCSYCLIINADNELYLAWLYDKDQSVHLYHPIKLGAFNAQDRIGENTNRLNMKKVGIVGLGSAGSKIAVTLARSGVTNFVLVDDDLFLLENICRHELDWRNIGDHKVVAIEDRLSLISPDIKVDVRRIKLTGQESTASVAGAMHALSECDVIVDATADPVTFNRLAMITTQFKKTLIWLEIYAGGLGGMVARSRYGKDASPQNMRTAYHAYTAKVDAPLPVEIAPYTTEGEKGPIVASDADVSVISAHASRFVLDALYKHEPSTFPNSMYLIGLARGWDFEQPFDTKPIDAGPPEPAENTDLSKKEVIEGVHFLKELLERESSGNSPAS